ncbi:hypothetical protein [Ralstonia pseudosolanacearum]|uniref:hypothetical protein n=1 Tax=Ralstonia pseudosolanacearum TaxID=1310165 RepID=UPI003CF4B70E
MILAAYTVDTAANGFAPAWWPATSIKRALRLARSLSEKLSGDKRYPNAFWVMGENHRPVCKFFRGKRYEPNETI